MPHLGYALSSEEHSPQTLVSLAQRAEQAGFSFALISDHFHPWVDKQGHSPFVWDVIGGIAATTKKLRLGTGVTCPIMRIHPAIIAQAAATAATMMPGRFFLGVGTGENLNEHILGHKWPAPDVRREMLEEAVELMRILWQGGLKTYRGRYFVVENARLYTLPKEPVPVYVAAGGEHAARLAGRIGDGLITVGAVEDVVKVFSSSGGANKPKYGQITVCWDESEQEARRIVYEVWPIAGLAQPLLRELPLPSHFEAAAGMVTEEKVAEALVCGPDPEKHIQAIRECEKAGCEYIYIHQIGKNQEGFFRFYQNEVLPKFGHSSGAKLTFTSGGNEMKVRDAMTYEVEVIGPEKSVREAARRMQVLDIGFIPVCDGGRLIGTITDRDIAVRLVADGLDMENTTVGDVMTAEVFFCYDDQDLKLASRVMQDTEVRRLVVMTRDQKVAGVLSLGDIALIEGQERTAGETLRETSDPAA